MQVESIKPFEFAVDIVTCLDTVADSQRYLSPIETIANSAGLYINHKKTEYIELGGSPDAKIALSVQAGPLARVDQFRYHLVLYTPSFAIDIQPTLTAIVSNVVW